MATESNILQKAHWIEPEGLSSWKELIACFNNSAGEPSCYLAPLRLCEKQYIQKLIKSVAQTRKEEGFKDFKPIIFVALPPFYEVSLRYCRYLTQKRSSFQDITQALFCAELIPWDKGDDFVNIVTFQDLLAPDKNGCHRITRLSGVLEGIAKDKWYGKWLEQFYKSFVWFYDIFSSYEQNDYQNLNDWDEVRMELNGIDSSAPHAVTLEPFRAPVPFVFHELFQMRADICAKLKGDKLKFLWIDNKPFVNRKHEKLAEVMKSGLGDDFFTIDRKSVV